MVAAGAAEFANSEGACCGCCDVAAGVPNKLPGFGVDAFAGWAEPNKLPAAGAWLVVLMPLSSLFISSVSFLIGMAVVAATEAARQRHRWVVEEREREMEGGRQREREEERERERRGYRVVLVMWMSLDAGRVGGIGGMGDDR